MDNKSSVNTYLRSDATWDAYQKEPLRGADECFLCAPENLTIVKVFQYWLIVENQYPYDNVAEVHHMLVPIRHFARERDADRAESSEALEILQNLEEDSEYDCILKNYPKGQSHRSHFHYHLITWKHR